MVTAQDSSPPSVVRKGFLCCGHGSLRLPCPQHKKTRAAVECRFIEHVRRGIKHLNSYHSSYNSGFLCVRTFLFARKFHELLRTPRRYGGSPFLSWMQVVPPQAAQPASTTKHLRTAVECRFIEHVQ